MTTEEKNTLIAICDDLLKTLDPDMESEKADAIVANSIKSIYLRLLDKVINIKVSADFFTDYHSSIDNPKGGGQYSAKIIEQ